MIDPVKQFCCFEETLKYIKEHESLRRIRRENWPANTYVYIKWPDNFHGSDMEVYLYKITHINFRSKGNVWFPTTEDIFADNWELYSYA